MSASVKISINDEIATVLERVKQQYPTLDTPELFKLSLAEFDRMLIGRRRKAWVDSLPTLPVSAEEAAEIVEARAEIKSSRRKPLTAEELISSLADD